jgi:arylsulfatase A-like enzyme
MADCYSYVTASAPNAGEPPDANLDDPHRAGFQTFRGNVYNVGGSYTWWKVEDEEPTFVDGSVLKDETTYPSAVNATDAAAWLSAQSGPFFAYVAIGAPHAQFTVPPFTMLSDTTQSKLTSLGLAAGDAFPATASVRNSPGMLQLWRSSIEATDTALQRIYDSIPAEQRARTWLVITGDNGTVGAGLPPGFLHQKRELFWGGSRVPFLVVGPGVAAPGRRAKQIVHVADVYRTVCELMRVRVPETTAQDSVSFVPVLRDLVDRENRNALREAVYVQQFAPNQEPGGTAWHASSRQRGVFDGDWRLVDLAGVQLMTRESRDPLELSANRLSEEIPVGDQNYARLRALMLAAMPD